MINDFHYNRCCDLMKDHGGSVVVGNPNSHEDKKLTPTIVLTPAKDSALMKGEIFGPILPVYTY